MRLFKISQELIFKENIGLGKKLKLNGYVKEFNSIVTGYLRDKNNLILYVKGLWKPSAGTLTLV